MNKCPHKRNHFNPENAANHWFFLRRAVRFLGGKCNLSGYPFPWDPQTSDLAKRIFCGPKLWGVSRMWAKSSIYVLWWRIWERWHWWKLRYLKLWERMPGKYVWCWKLEWRRTTSLTSNSEVKISTYTLPGTITYPLPVGTCSRWASFSILFPRWDMLVSWEGIFLTWNSHHWNSQGILVQLTWTGPLVTRQRVRCDDQLSLHPVPGLKE